MQPERWREIERLYHAALEREGRGRVAFLKEACAGDEELRHEVESLLASDAKAGSFIESPAMEVAARSLAANAGDRPAEEVTAPLRLGAQLGTIASWKS